MAQKLTATATGSIDAEPAAVWRVLTDPELLSQAFFGAKVETDWRAGSPITFTGEWNGKSFQDKGEIVTVEPDRTLSFTHYSPLSGQPDVPENYHTVTFELTPRGGSTELSISQTNAGSEEEREHSAANWARVVESIRHLAER